MRTARKKILIADCHQEVLIALEKLLEDEGFDTRTAWTAKDALLLLGSEPFDLVLVNEYLPDAECEEILKALQRRGGQTPCIVMQPSSPEITDIAALESGCHRCGMQVRLSAHRRGCQRVSCLRQKGPRWSPERRITHLIRYHRYLADLRRRKGHVQQSG